MTDYKKPLPEISDDNRGFWEATRQGELRLQRCTDCCELRYPVAQICPACLSASFDWDRVSGRGTVFSFVVFHQVYHPAYKDDVPYNVAMIQLEEGPRMISNIVDVSGQVEAGTPVEAVFDHVTEEVSIPRFRIVPAS